MRVLIAPDKFKGSLSALDVAEQLADGLAGAGVAVRGDTAVMEIANTCGLATLPNGMLAPGGSASTGCGTGLLAALSFCFRDEAGVQVEAAARHLADIHTIDARHAVDLSGVDLMVATDVSNPLTGPTGAAAAQRT